MIPRLSNPRIMQYSGMACSEWTLQFRQLIYLFMYLFDELAQDLEGVAERLHE